MDGRAKLEGLVVGQRDLQDKVMPFLTRSVCHFRTEALSDS